MKDNEELIKSILEAFEKIKDQNRKISDIQEKAKAGKTTYKEVSEYASEVGETLAKAYKENITPETVPGSITREVAEAIIPGPMQNNYNLVSEVAIQTQEAMNQAAGIHIKAIQPEINTDRINGLVKKVSSYKTTKQAFWVLDEPIVNATQSISDDFVKANADFQYNAGLNPKIVREEVGGCCPWCSDRAGIYDYDEVSGTGNDVFRRHEHCRCTVTYELGRKRWDVWSKKRLGDADPKKIRARQQNYEKHQLQSDRDADKIEKRKRIGLDDNVKRDFIRQIVAHPEMLGQYTPGELKDALEKMGYSVVPLSDGSLKGRKFEDGGGYKVNFGGDGILQYHPEKGSHHNGEYYKTSTGLKGITWYDRYGNEIRYGNTDMRRKGNS